MKKLICILITLLLLTGCATLSKKMESWMGSDVNDLIASWGAPQQIMSDGKGGQILIYSVSSEIQMVPGQADKDMFGNISYTPPQNITINSQRMFWADSNGKIYRWSLK